MIKKLIILVFISSLKPLFAQNHEPIVDRFITAFNEQNITKMLQVVSNDILWQSISNDKMQLETRGKAALEKAMLGYFNSPLKTQSSIVSSQNAGPFISVVERAQWLSEGKKKQQCSLAIYRVQSELITHVWYHNAYQCQ